MLPRSIGALWRGSVRAETLVAMRECTVY